MGCNFHERKDSQAEPTAKQVCNEGWCMVGEQEKQFLMILLVNVTEIGLKPFIIP
jgi:hypothetical protein